ncbi:RNA polymerase factor sigma-54 [Myxococcota bacterium]|nr:RNA polymerase factor sigma-54 [Myxococcota bacterium]MBU1534300.1 RNA polymerase factor sigma-54 [Myxococcota bacterium]
MGFDLRQTTTLNLRQEQRLVMTQQMQQAIALLQLAHHELIEQVTEELMENPILEQNDGDREEGDRDDSERDTNEREEQDRVDRDGDGEERFSSLEVESVGVQEVPSSENMSVNEENKMREDVEWSSYVADSYNRPAGSGDQVLNPDEEYTPIENRIASKPSLLEHLEWQLGVSGLSHEEKEIGEFIIGNLDKYGYLETITIPEIAEQFNVENEFAELVLYKIQAFDPLGVGARDLAECLMIQAEYFGFLDDVMEQILLHHIKELEIKDYSRIARALGVPLERVHDSIKIILTLDPKPGRAYTAEEISYIIPDVYIYRQGDDYQVVLNDDGLPKLRLSRYYIDAMNRGDAPKEYVEQKMRKAKWLIQAIRMRQETITKVSESIVKFQREFFDRGPMYIKPLTLKDVAEDVGRHESTVSRVTANKYAHTPQGLFELKFFFSSSVHRVNGEDIASKSVIEKMRLLIESEDPKKPYSDQKLADLLLGQGINVARRTVTKYREQMNILSSSRRRSPF